MNCLYLTKKINCLSTSSIMIQWRWKFHGRLFSRLSFHVWTMDPPSMTIYGTFFLRKEPRYYTKLSKFVYQLFANNFQILDIGNVNPEMMISKDCGHTLKAQTYIWILLNYNLKTWHENPIVHAPMVYDFMWLYR